MSSAQQYRVIGKSGPGVEPRAGMVIAFIRRDGTRDDAYTLDAKIAAWCKRDDISGPDWNAGEYEILEAISSPQAAVATCESWCGGAYRKSPAYAQIWNQDNCRKGNCPADCPCPTYCTQACIDRAKIAKPQTCIRSACKAPPVAGGELCAAHACQVEAAKASSTKKQCDGTLAKSRGVISTFLHCQLRHGHAGPHQWPGAPALPPPAETRLERWRREHKGYSHGNTDPRIHDANVAAMMVGRDGPREPYVPPPPLAAWTPRDLDGDIPDAWERGGSRLRHQMRKDR